MNEAKQKTWWVVEFAVDSRQEDLASWLMMHIGARGCEIVTADDADDVVISTGVVAGGVVAGGVVAGGVVAGGVVAGGVVAEGVCNGAAVGTGNGGSALVRIRATFDVEMLPNGDTTRISSELEEYGLSTSISTLRIMELQEEDWLAKWKVGFEPFPVGEKLLVCPAWLRADLSKDVSKDRAVILIEPGLAFGTGFHATTRFCLGAVERYVGTAKTVLDVGTGSGILAVGAALLNQDATIVAVENDPSACNVARENFELNGVVGRIQLVEGITDDLTADQRHKYDLLLSNLTYEDNTALLPEYAKLCHSKTRLVFAGILKEKLELMLVALEKNSFVVTEREVGDMWAGLVAQPRNS